jgi:hypothetical protein
MSKMPARGISHPKFNRRNNTEYAVINLDHKSPWHVHVGQIMAYLATDDSPQEPTEEQVTDETMKE